MARFYVNELFAPFKDVMPKDVYPEMAWFIGAATDAIRFEDRLRHEKSLSVQDRILRQGRRMDWLPPANDEKPEAIAASATRLTRMRENLKNGVPVRSTTEILNDPAAVNRMKKMIGKIFTEYPGMGQHVGDLVAAKEDFTDMYLGRESQQVVGNVGR